MSTKIHGGFKVVGLGGLFELHREIMTFRQELAGRIRTLNCTWVAKRAAGVFDDWTLGRYALPKGETAFTHAALELLDRQAHVLETDRRDPEVDFSCHLSIHPLEREGENVILGIVFAERAEFQERWFNKPFVEDYHYQNSTDRPEDIPEVEWDRRREDWLAVLGHPGVPALAGFLGDVGDQAARAYYLLRAFGLQAEVATQSSGGVPNIEDVLPLVPSFESRVSRIAKDDLWTQTNRRWIPDAGMVEPTRSGNVQGALRFLRWLETPEGVEALAEHEARIRPKLRPTLTRDDLLPA